jgi:hypothetical protein
MGIDKVVVVFCHSRAKLLDKCLNSIKIANSKGAWTIVIVHQVGYSSVDKVIKKYEESADFIVSIKPNFDFSLGNINKNRYIGTEFAFNLLGAKLVLGIEEDNIISPDSLLFCEFAFNKYAKFRAFRGINLGSIESKPNISLNGYSLLRFGIHGSAGALTKKSWDYIKKKRLLIFDYEKLYAAWDAKIEFYLKSGFMVTPNLSRNLDLGYAGTFAPTSKNDPYFVNNRKSWIGNKNLQSLTYRHIQIRHAWRFDSIAYKRRQSFIFYIRRYTILDKIAKFTKVKTFVAKVLK